MIISPTPQRDKRTKVILLGVRMGWILQQALLHKKPCQISTMTSTTTRGKRCFTGSTAVWLLVNHFSPEDEEQAVGLEKADLVQMI